MNRQETAKLLAMISVYYGRSKADADMMVNAWHLLLKDYDYAIAEQAVIEYAKNDTREYSQFPNIGQVISSIKEEEKCFIVIRNCAYYNKEYNEVPERGRKWISEDRYNRLKECPESYLLENLDEIKKTLIKGKMLIGGEK